MFGCTDPGNEDWVVTTVALAPVAPGTRLINSATAWPFRGSSIMRVVPTTSVNVGVAASTSGADEPTPETVTVSVAEPIFNCTSMVAV